MFFDIDAGRPLSDGIIAGHGFGGMVGGCDDS